MNTGVGKLHQMLFYAGLELEEYQACLPEIRKDNRKKLRAATASKVRVLIESSDGVDSWTTVGVSKDIIEASWIALVDSIEYKLIKDIETKFRDYL